MNLKEIAEQLGVSQSSISIVRKGKPGVSSAVRRRIQLTLEKNGYSYDAYIEDHQDLANKLQNLLRKGGSICLLKHARSALLTDQNEGFIAGLIEPISVAISAAGYTLEVNAVNSEEYSLFLQNLPDMGYSGMIVIATEMDQKELSDLSQVQIPTVVLDSDYPYIPHSSVTMNNRQLAWQAVACLAKCGEVGYLRSSQKTGNFIARMLGYREALQSFSLPDDPQLVFSLTPSLDGAERDMTQYLDEGHRIPPALFADNDVIAIGCMRALTAHHYRIPHDIQLIGVDDTLLSQVISPSLSSIQISRVQMAQQAVRLLMEAISSPAHLRAHIHIDAQLIYRDSLSGGS
ncbi:MAG: LacI family DNA-binding transcriptional regulator [Clostridia bacterium]|nr:LacI family DNA-binding transcriptional regulator [Clostridia bacterium]